MAHLRSALGLLLLFSWLASHVPEALAHALVDHSTPKPGAVLTSAPARVDIWFTEHLTPGVSSIEVFDAERRRVDRGDSTVDPTDTRHMDVAMQQLSSGLYTVIWSNLSADDGHPNKGAFAFTVLLPVPAAVQGPAAGAPVGPTATAAPLPTPLPLPSESQQAVADLLNPATDRPTAGVDLVGGWLTFSALVLAGGGALFALLCLLPALDQVEQVGGALAVRLQRRFYLVTLIAALIGAGAALVSLLAKAEIATGLPPADLLSRAVLAPLLQAWAGVVWLLREAVFGLVASAAVVGLTLTRPRARTAAHREGPGPFDPAGQAQSLLLALIVGLGGAGLLFQALDSHLAAGHVARSGPLGTADLSLHLLAVGAWIGGLGYAAIMLWPAWGQLPKEAQAAIAAVGIARFSPLALASVVVITITGTYAAVLLLPLPSDLLTSAYGQALDVKLALLLVLILFGAANRRTLARLALIQPRTHSNQGAEARFWQRRSPSVPATRQGLAASIGNAAWRLVRAMRLEFLIAGVVLLAAGTMLEVGPPGVALAAGAVSLEDVVPLAALPTTPIPVPPTETARPSPTPGRYAATKSSGDLTLTLSVDPAVAGTVSTLQVEASGKNGAATTNAEVKLRLTAQAIDVGTEVFTATQATPGVYRVATPAFAVAGPWEVVLNVRRDNVPEVDATFTVPVLAPPSAAPPSPTAQVAATASPSPGSVRAALAFRPDPPAVGSATASLQVSEGAGQPVTGARLQVIWLMPQHAHLTQTAFDPSASPGVYATTVDLSMAGAWLAEVTLTLPDGRSTLLKFAFNVRDRGLFGV